MIPTIFNFDSTNDIRVVDQDGNPWFVLRDILSAMGSTTRPADALSVVKEVLGDGVVNDYSIVDSLGRNQQVTIVSEAAATYLVARSNTEAGRKLNRFLHVEVLPQIRRTGTYSPNKEKREEIGIAKDIYELATKALEFARFAGFSENMAILAADNHIKHLTGSSLLAAMGTTHLVANEQGRTYTPTELGGMLFPKLSGRGFNELLEVHGFQIRDTHNNVVPTAKASGMFEWLDTGRRYTNGAPVKQVKWFKRVITELSNA